MRSFATVIPSLANLLRVWTLIAQRARVCMWVRRPPRHLTLIDQGPKIADQSSSCSPTARTAHFANRLRPRRSVRPWIRGLLIAAFMRNSRVQSSTRLQFLPNPFFGDGLLTCDHRRAFGLLSHRNHRSGGPNNQRTRRVSRSWISPVYIGQVPGYEQSILCLRQH